MITSHESESSQIPILYCTGTGSHGTDTTMTISFRLTRKHYNRTEWGAFNRSCTSTSTGFSGRFSRLPIQTRRNSAFRVARHARRFRKFAALFGLALGCEHYSASSHISPMSIIRHHAQKLAISIMSHFIGLKRTPQAVMSQR